MIDTTIQKDLQTKEETLDRLHDDLTKKTATGSITRDELKDALKVASTVVNECVIALDDHNNGTITLSTGTLTALTKTLRAADTVLGDVILVFSNVK